MPLNADLITDPALQNTLQNAGWFGVGLGGPVGCDQICEPCPNVIPTYAACMGTCLSGGDASTACPPRPPGSGPYGSDPIIPGLPSTNTIVLILGLVVAALFLAPRAGL